MRSLVSVPLELPVLVVEGATILLLEPSRDAVEVKSVITDTPGSRALFCCVCDLVGLAVDAVLHDVVFTDCTVVDGDV